VCPTFCQSNEQGWRTLLKAALLLHINVLTNTHRLHILSQACNACGIELAGIVARPRQMSSFLTWMEFSWIPSQR
jgi:hypothetical protein